jgi:hypothetical protein
MSTPNPFSPPQAQVEDVSAAGPSRPSTRPRQVELAYRLVLASLALGMLNHVLGRLGSFAFTALVLLLLFGLGVAMRAGHNWARIVFLVLFLLGLPTLFATPSLVAQFGVAFLVVFCVQTILQIGTLWLVFTQPGSSWFRKHAHGT